ncbi:hypothetical protein EIL50_03630, partial [bacterium NHP-B]
MNTKRRLAYLCLSSCCLVFSLWARDLSDDLTYQLRMQGSRCLEADPESWSYVRELMKDPDTRNTVEEAGQWSRQELEDFFPTRELTPPPSPSLSRHSSVSELFSLEEETLHPERWVHTADEDEDEEAHPDMRLLSFPSVDSSEGGEGVYDVVGAQQRHREGYRRDEDVFVPDRPSPSQAVASQEASRDVVDQGAPTRPPRLLRYRNRDEEGVHALSSSSRPAVTQGQASASGGVTSQAPGVSGSVQDASTGGTDQTQTTQEASQTTSQASSSSRPRRSPLARLGRAFRRLISSGGQTHQEERATPSSHTPQQQSRGRALSPGPIIVADVTDGQARVGQEPVAQRPGPNHVISATPVMSGVSNVRRGSVDSIGTASSLLSNDGGIPVPDQESIVTRPHRQLQENNNMPQGQGGETRSPMLQRPHNPPPPPPTPSEVVSI